VLCRQNLFHPLRACVTLERVEVKKTLPAFWMTAERASGRIGKLRKNPHDTGPSGAGLWAILGAAPDNY
jgi:hypothetical protein